MVGRLDAVSDEINGRGLEVAQSLANRVEEFENRVVARLSDVSSDIDARGRPWWTSSPPASRNRLDAQCRAPRTRPDAAPAHRRTRRDDRQAGDRRQYGDRRQSREPRDFTAHARRSLSELLSSRSSDLHQIFDTKGALLIDLLTARGDEVSKELASVGELVTNAIEQRSSAVVEHLARKQADIVGAVGGVHDKVRDELSVVLTRLGETNNAPARGIVGQASSNLSSLDSTLVEKLAQFRASIEMASSNVEQIASTATSVTEQNEILNNAVQALSQAQAAL